MEATGKQFDLRDWGPAWNVLIGLQRIFTKGQSTFWCHWGRSGSSTSLQRRGGGERWPGCPKEEKPCRGSCFLKTCVLCASFDPTFPFWGQKIYSLLSDGVFTISVQTTTTIARRGIWTLNRHIWTYKLLLEQHQDHWSYIFETGVAGRWKSYFVTYFKVSHIYAAKQCSDKMWVLVQGKESKRATFNAGKFFPSWL